MARSRLVRLSYSLQDPMRDEGTREQSVAPLEELRRTRRRASAKGRIASSYIPVLLGLATIDELREHFVTEMGCEFDFGRIIASMGVPPTEVPQRLAGTLLIELSKHLHPHRRRAFLSAAWRGDSQE